MHHDLQPGLVSKTPHPLSEPLPLLHAGVLEYQLLDADGDCKPDKGKPASPSVFQLAGDAKARMAKSSKTKNPSPVEALRRDELLLMNVYAEFLHRHGPETTRRMFANYAKAPTKDQLRNYRDQKLLARYDAMLPRPNVLGLAKKLVDENRALSKPYRHFPTLATLKRHLDRILEKRRSKRPTKQKAGSVSYPLSRDEPAAFFLIDLQQDLSKLSWDISNEEPS